MRHSIGVLGGKLYFPQQGSVANNLFKSYYRYFVSKTNDQKILTSYPVGTAQKRFVAVAELLSNSQK